MPRSGHRSAGSATVEFALVLPLVLVQVGLLVRDRLLVEAAARAAARAAAVQDDPAAITSAALAAAPGLDPARASVETTRVGERGSPVTVRFLYAESFRVPLVGWLVGSGVTLTAEAAARQEFG